MAKCLSLLEKYYIELKDILVHNAQTRISKVINGEDINSAFNTNTDVNGTLEIIEINENQKFFLELFNLMQ